MTAQLDTLLRLRQHEVDRCQLQLASAVRHEQTFQARIGDLDRQCEQQRAELSRLTQQGELDLNAFQLRQRHLQLLTEQLLQAQAECERATLNMQQQRATLLTADQRRQVIEKLQERRLNDSR